MHAGCNPDGWILCALRGLQSGTNDNVLIEKVIINIFDHSEASAVEIAKYCPKLQYLFVSFDIGEDSILALSRHCPLLKKLSTDWIPRISTEQSAALCAPVLSCIQSMQTPYVIGQHSNVLHYAMVLPYLTELQEVCLGGCIDHLLLPLISQYCRKIISVGVMHGTTATATQILQLAQSPRYLHSVFLSSNLLSTDELVIGIAERCPNLIKLVIDAEWEFVTVTALSTVQSYMSWISIRVFSLLKLQYYNLYIVARNYMYLRYL